jgi:aspartate kinase
VEGKPVNTLYEILEELKIKPNLTQNAAISLYVCMDDIPEKVDKIALRASKIFDVQLERNLTLLTIRHYTEEFLNKLSENKIIVLQQKTADTIQMLMREI